MANDTAADVPHARLKLGLMFVLPAVAVLLATLVFYTGVGIPHATTNKGVLLQPPRQIDQLALREATGAAWRYDSTRRGWGILLAGTGHCDDACRDRIVLTRQVRIALGRDADRLQRYYLAADTLPDEALRGWLRAEHADLEVLQTEAPTLRALLAHAGEPDPLASGAVYLVDPRGFVMMYYLPAQPGNATLDDLRFLLRNSAD